jgi:hypothetical protein
MKTSRIGSPIQRRTASSRLWRELGPADRCGSHRIKMKQCAWVRPDVVAADPVPRMDWGRSLETYHVRCNQGRQRPFEGREGNIAQSPCYDLDCCPRPGTRFSRRPCLTPGTMAIRILPLGSLARSSVYYECGSRHLSPVTRLGLRWVRRPVLAARPARCMRRTINKR